MWMQKVIMIMVIGCSTSEVVGSRIGTNSDVDVALELFLGIKKALDEKGVFLAAQCCAHLNRAIVVEQAAVPGADIVNVVPQKKAGGSFATQAYAHFEKPVVLEEIKAHAGLDIGNTLIGMHLKAVAVPVRLSIDHIGHAPLVAALSSPHKCFPLQINPKHIVIPRVCRQAFPSSGQ